GPWSIQRRERLRRLRDIAADPSNNERALDFSVRFASRRQATADTSPTVPTERPVDQSGDDDQ
ncbi:MAG: hypothetical protein JJD93_01560, partial [Ilumatobacteraceae bacterium]|nr:hypothetical protein [Ilumatobacteraceae bacterium]